MKSNVIIVKCKVPSEAYQILSKLRKKPGKKDFKISYAALVKKDNGKLSLEDGFSAEAATEGRGWKGGLIGGLVGLLAGPVGALAGGAAGALIGNSLDAKEKRYQSALAGRFSHYLDDGETALFLLAEEKDKAALEEKLKDYQVAVIRVAAKEFAAEVDKALKKSRKGAAGTKAAETLIFGNIITMDEKKPFAKAALVRGGVFAFIGGAEEAKALAGADAQVLDYGENYIYPGFLEAHSHGYLAGDRAIGQANLSKVLGTDYAKYREIIKEFIEKNPQREFYMAAGWAENDEKVTKAYLDEICPDKPLIMNTGGGHSMLLNTKALEWAGIDREYAEKHGPAEVHVDENGEPDGYVCEGPVFEIMPRIPKTMEDAKNFLLAWQDIAFKTGYTAVGDAGVELVSPMATQAYYELEQEGKLKLRTYAYLRVAENAEDPKAEIARATADRAKYSNEYFHVVGVKTFLDGVIEAHTGWQLADYLDQPGYHGLERFNDHDKMVELITAANAEGLSVHVHSIGNGATSFMLGCIEDAEKITGNLDQRNVLAHLQYVADEDIRRMAETGSIPAVPPLWTPNVPGGYDMEVAYVGKELADQAYPIKSFYDAGANVVFHSDYPVSPMMDIKLSVYTAEKRAYPEALISGASPRNVKEAITREQSLRAMTINVARQWRQEERMGSIEFGKLANMTVFDCDFLHDDIEKVAQANIVATIVDGEEVYKA